MKLFRYCVIVTLSLLSSCEVEEIERHTGVESQDEDEGFSKSNNSDPNNKSLYHKGKLLYSGFGYNSNSEKILQPAFSTDEINYKSSQGSDYKYSASISIIKNYKSFLTYLTKSTPFTSNNSLIRLKVKDQGSKFISKQEGFKYIKNLTENTTVVIARISFRDDVYFCDGLPTFNENAKSLLESGKTERFFEQYGTSFLSSQRLGGDLYYYYAFRNANFYSDQVTQLERQIHRDLNSFFNKQSDVNPFDKDYIKSNLRKSGFFTNIKGYVPKTIRNRQDLYSESVRFSRYLQDNPKSLASIEYSTEPYSSKLENIDTKFLKEFRDKSICYENKQAWKKILEDLRFLKNNSKKEAFKRKVNNEFLKVKSNYYAAENCSNIIPVPSQSQYDYLKNEYYEEIRTN